MKGEGKRDIKNYLFSLSVTDP